MCLIVFSLSLSAKTWRTNRITIAEINKVIPPAGKGGERWFDLNVRAFSRKHKYAYMKEVISAMSLMT